MNKYKVKIIRPTQSDGLEEYIQFENKSEMYKWLTSELNMDTDKQTTFEIIQLRSDEE